MPAVQGPTTPDRVRLVLSPNGELVVFTPNHRAAVVLLARALYGLGLKFAVREIFGSNHVGFFDDRTLSAALQRAGFVTRKLDLFPYDPSRPGQYVSPVSLAAVTVVERLGQPFGRMFRMLAYAQAQGMIGATRHGSCNAIGT